MQNKAQNSYQGCVCSCYSTLFRLSPAVLLIFHRHILRTCVAFLKILRINEYSIMSNLHFEYLDMNNVFLAYSYSIQDMILLGYIFCGTLPSLSQFDHFRHIEYHRYNNIKLPWIITLIIQNTLLSFGGF